MNVYTNQLQVTSGIFGHGKQRESVTELFYTTPQKIQHFRRKSALPCQSYRANVPDTIACFTIKFHAISLTNKKFRSAIMLPLLCLCLLFCNCALCSTQVWLHRVSHDFYFFSRLNQTIDSVFAVVITSNPVHVQRSTRNNEINWRLGIFRFPIVLLPQRKTLSKPFFLSSIKQAAKSREKMLQSRLSLLSRISMSNSSLN